MPPEASNSSTTEAWPDLTAVIRGTSPSGQAVSRLAAASIRSLTALRCLQMGPLGGPARNLVERERERERVRDRKGEREREREREREKERHSEKEKD